ncbi:MAG: zinc ribbon domain-containing protein [Actinobacteria bacterium]|nr:zinc ribbon domain-containing protein [Actinomycetota bacterium]MCG2819865.1 zinc ribbon domain-containing protein [Actinomycetes bacterium]MBU4219150.1 zinc ribbon domain-containing protein [Actinomycetota bacterium]MBU4358437.1 zinc ribbon domain-containing protein [Actinomycetota bacterium]MBU4392839.1 zinc ribbon domain-containing protein [Actinomycetota bacterium]
MNTVAQMLYDPNTGLLVYVIILASIGFVGTVVWLVYKWKKVSSDRERTWRLLESFTEKPPGNIDGTVIVKKEVPCPNCGGDVQSIDSICRHCGSDLDLLPAGDKASGVIKREIVINGVVVFHERELVQVESVKPDPDRPEFKYVVRSNTVDRRFRLSDDDIMT